MRYPYKKLTNIEFYETFTTEDAARDFLWQTKFEGKDFVCPHCECERYLQFHARPEIRQCALCDRRTRLRPGTIFQNSKLPLLTWLRALQLMITSKRGVSALELQRHLKIRTYRTAWRMLRRIRPALAHKDEQYELGGVVEVDGAHFDSVAARGQRRHCGVMLAVESKQWVDERGKTKEKAGFAKVKISRETTILAQKFLDESVEAGAEIHTDAARAYNGVTGFDVQQEKMLHLPVELDKWLPWVHRFISNAKAWLIGTHHGVSSKYLSDYLAEFTYRFNRRHDPDGLLHRALRACCLAQYSTLGALCA